LTNERIYFTLRDETAKLPTRATDGSAGYDLYAAGSYTVRVPAGEQMLIKTGVSISLPQGYEAQVRPRSGLALKHRVTVLNSPGTIDSDFRNEIGVLLMNHGVGAFEVRPGDRIAQLVIAKYEVLPWIEVDVLDETQRKGGWGSTGR